MFEGKPRKRSDGRWELQITIGVDQSGKRIRKSFYGNKQKEVCDKKDRWLKEQNVFASNIMTNISDPITSQNKVLFEEWADKWLEIKKETVRPYTYKNTYYTRVEKYLKPYFKGRPIDAISQIDIQIFFEKHKKISLALQKTLKTILHNMFVIAMANDLCIKNPVINIKLMSSYIKKEKKYFNKAQQRTAIDWSIKNKQYDVLTVLKTGMRRGELLGLRWCDIDFENKIISIEQSYCDGIDGEEPDLELKSTSSRRQIPVDDELLQCLGGIEHTSDLVFPYVSAKAYGSHIARVLRRMATECNLPYLTLHELRHTYGTVLRENQVDLYTISKVLGHSDVGVTSKIYVHNDIEVLRNALKIETTS